MRCPYCNKPDTRVLDSRPAEEGNIIRRRRECGSCGVRFTTYERVEARPLVVVKKDGRREVFDRSKVLAGMLKACEKRPVSLATLEEAGNAVEQQLIAGPEVEVTSREVGELVMEQLRRLDEVAYVRFASVYREFKDLETFMRELQQVLAARGEA